MASIYDKSSLVLIPSGTKTGKVYSQKPVSGDGDFTFTRSSAATRVNADGFIEKETQNNVLQSNTFSSATWIKQQSGGTTPVVTSGFTDPYGGSNAWRLQCSISGGLYSMISQGLSTTGLNCNSIWIKSNTGSNQDVYFRINNADQSTTRTATTEWQRIEVFTDAVGQSFTIGVRSPATGATSSCDVLIYAAQSNQGLIAQEVITTTTTAVEGGITDNVPRLDYTDSSCPALLLEPQRSNLFEFSEYFGTSDWSKDSISITTNDSESVEGVNNATLLYPSSTGSISYIHNTTSGSASKYTISAFVKADGKDVVWLYISSGSGNGTIYFDLSDESIQVVAGGNGTPIGTITDIGNDWYRITFTLGSNQQITSGSGIGVSDAKGSTSVTKSGEDGILIYGLQIEEGSYATSYIPTYGSSVTRVADYSVRSDMQDYVGADEGSWFMHFKDLFFDITGTGQGSINLVYNSGNQIEFIQDGNLQYKITLNNSTAVSNLDGEDKVAIAWSLSGLVIYINGVSRYTSTSSAYANPYSTFELTRVDRRPRVNMKQILFFNTRISNEELAALTTI